MVHTCNPNIHKVKAKESGAQAHSQICSEFGASLDYKKLSFFKKKKVSKITCVMAALQEEMGMVSRWDF